MSLGHFILCFYSLLLFFAFILGYLRLGVGNGYGGGILLSYAHFEVILWVETAIFLLYTHS